MSQRRLSTPLALFVVLTCASIAFFIFFGRDFPPQMAIHFNTGGHANGYMDRVKFIVLGSFLSFMVPTFIAAMVGVLPRILPASQLNVPNKDYWSAPEHRAEALDIMLWFGLWLAVLVQAFMLVINVGIYRANLAPAPTLGAAGLLIIVPAVLLPVGMFTMIGALFHAFRIPRANLR